MGQQIWMCECCHTTDAVEVSEGAGPSEVIQQITDDHRQKSSQCNMRDITAVLIAECLRVFNHTKNNLNGVPRWARREVKRLLES